MSAHHLADQVTASLSGCQSAVPGSDLRYLTRQSVWRGPCSCPALTRAAPACPRASRRASGCAHGLASSGRPPRRGSPSWAYARSSRLPDHPVTVDPPVGERTRPSGSMWSALPGSGPYNVTVTTRSDLIGSPRSQAAAQLAARPSCPISASSSVPASGRLRACPLSRSPAHLSSSRSRRTSCKRSGQPDWMRPATG